MIRIIGLSGSLREHSYNSSLLRAAVQVQPENLSVEVASIKGIPLYDGDVEVREGIPSQVTVLKDLIARSDGLLLVTPEYNNSIPGVFKNAIDWLTRPPEDVPRVWKQRPVALIGASPGNFGTILSQAAWLPVLRTLGTRPWFGGRLQVSRVAQAFNEGGDLIDAKIRLQLAEFLKGFAAFIEAGR